MNVGLIFSAFFGVQCFSFNTFCLFVPIVWEAREVLAVKWNSAYIAYIVIIWLLVPLCPCSIHNMWIIKALFCVLVMMWHIFQISIHSNSSCVMVVFITPLRTSRCKLSHTVTRRVHAHFYYVQTHITTFMDGHMHSCTHTHTHTITLYVSIFSLSHRGSDLIRV